VLIARTDAHSANLLTSDVDDADKPFCTGKRTPEGFYYVNCGVKVPPPCCWLLRCAGWLHRLAARRSSQRSWATSGRRQCGRLSLVTRPSAPLLLD
jgi:hypothetical protein